MQLMQLSLSRWTRLGTLCAVVALASATGCRSGGMGSSWSQPSSWLSWNPWSKSSAPAGSLANSKPSTSVPKPSATATPSPSTSLAAGTGVNPGAAAYTAAAPSYPTTGSAYGYPSYQAQQASAAQPAGATGQVQPSVGYQTGPYGMTSAQPAAPQVYVPPVQGGGQSWNQPAAHTGAQPSVYGQQEASPYSGSYSQPAGGYTQPAGGYTQPAQPNPYGAQPGYNGQSSYTPAAGATQPVSYDSPATTSPAASGGAYGSTYASPYAAQAAAASTNPATAPPPTTVPVSLATEAGSYRPGSTGASGVQNARYDQPAYGNTYMR
jgi:hypothetical protein